MILVRLLLIYNSKLHFLASQSKNFLRHKIVDSLIIILHIITKTTLSNRPNDECARPVIPQCPPQLHHTINNNNSSIAPFTLSLNCRRPGLCIINFYQLFVRTCCGLGAQSSRQFCRENRSNAFSHEAQTCNTCTGTNASSTQRDVLGTQSVWPRAPLGVSLNKLYINGNNLARLSYILNVSNMPTTTTTVG